MDLVDGDAVGRAGPDPAGRDLAFVVAAVVHPGLDFAPEGGNLTSGLDLLADLSFGPTDIGY